SSKSLNIDIELLPLSSIGIYHYDAYRINSKRALNRLHTYNKRNRGVVIKFDKRATVRDSQRNYAAIYRAIANVIEEYTCRPATFKSQRVFYRNHRYIA